MNPDWLRCDGWYRRQLRYGTYLMVSRTTLHRETERRVNKVGVTRIVPALWFWRLHRIDTGELVDQGGHSFSTPYSAMRAADRVVAGEAELVEVAA